MSVLQHILVHSSDKPEHVLIASRLSIDSRHVSLNRGSVEMDQLFNASDFDSCFVRAPGTTPGTAPGEAPRIPPDLTLLLASSIRQ